MENALNWLGARGITNPKSPLTGKPIKIQSDSRFQRQRRQSKSEVEVWSNTPPDGVFSEGSESSVDEEVARRKNKEGVSAAEMSSALNWLNKKGIAVRLKEVGNDKALVKPKHTLQKRRDSKQDISVDAAESLLEELKLTDSHGAPAVHAMEEALKFLKIRESERPIKPQRKPPSAEGVAKALSFLGKQSKPLPSKRADGPPLESITAGSASTSPALSTNKEHSQRRSSKSKLLIDASFKGAVESRASSDTKLTPHGARSGMQERDDIAKPDNKAQGATTTLNYVQGRSLKSTMKAKDSSLSSLKKPNDSSSSPLRDDAIDIPKAAEKEMPFTPKGSKDTIGSSTPAKKLPRQSARVTIVKNEVAKPASKPPDMSKALKYLQGRSLKTATKKDETSKESIEYTTEATKAIISKQTWRAKDSSSPTVPALKHSSAALLADDDAKRQMKTPPPQTPKETVKGSPSSRKSPQQGARVALAKNEKVEPSSKRPSGGENMANTVKYLQTKAMQSPGTRNKAKTSSVPLGMKAPTFSSFGDEPDDSATKRRPTEKPKTVVPTKSKSADRPKSLEKPKATMPVASKLTDKSKPKPPFPREQRKPEEDLVRKSATPPMRQKSKAEIDYSNALAWLEDNNVDDLDDAVYFKKLHNMLPKRASQTKEQRAKEMAKALIWVKRQGILDTAKEQKQPKDASKEQVKNEPVVKPSQPKPTKEEKKEKDSKESKVPTARKTLPTVKDIQKQAKALEKARNSPVPAEKGKVKIKKKSSGEPSPESDFENALNFVKTKEADGDFMSLEDAIHFKKLDNMLPTRANQSPENRAKEMVKMLTWWRKKGKV